MVFSVMVALLIYVVTWTGVRISVQGYNVLTPVQKRWWMDSASALEPFTNLSRSEEKVEELSDHSPGKPAPVDLYRMEPYHLLSDVLGKTRDSLSSVNSRSCYATDAEAYLSKVGNYRQLTNNYKREYPDHCSSPNHELVLNFYEAKPFTPSSVSSAGSAGPSTPMV